MAGRWTETTLTVTELTDRLKRELEPRFRAVEVRGEITSLRPNSGGHLYFVLKDDGAQLPCVVWRTTAARLPLKLADGQKVVLTGDLQLYPPQGRYQLVVSRVTDLGLGELLARLEELKQRLAQEGLFAPQRKRPLPALPRRVGLVTAPTGAAVHDFIVTAQARRPTRIVLAACRVQGDLAARSIVGALRALTRVPDVDVIVLARGGGSAVDLLPFSDERVVRAIAASPIPVISAVGHEIDTTLSDLAADRRAMTPTAAAELAIPRRSDLDRALAAALANATRLTERRIGEARLRLDRALHRLAKAHPAARLDGMRLRHSRATDRLHQAIRRRLGHDQSTLALAQERLRLLSPLGSLDRGWALVRRETGALVRGVGEVQPGERVSIRLRDGTLDAVIAARPEPSPSSVPPKESS